MLVVDIDNQMFAPDGKWIKAVGKKGSKPQEFDAPMGNAALRPTCTDTAQKSQECLWQT